MPNMTKKSNFHYTPRTPEQVKKRAEQKGGMFDRPYRDGVQVFTAQPGSHTLRILPPTWDNAEHYGIDAWLHSGIGIDTQSYLCLEKMQQGPCPICEEAKTIDKSMEKELAALKPYKRVLTWIIDRDNENEGPMLYPMPWTMDKTISATSTSKKTGAILQVDHPDEGYDIEFTKEGTGMRTQYTGTQISREQTPLHSDSRVADEWLNFVQENPIPDCLVFYDYDHIKAVFEGASSEAKASSQKNRTRNEEPEIEDRRGNSKEDREAFSDRLSGDDGTDDDSEAVELDEDPKTASTKTMSNRDKIRASLRK